MLPLASTVSGLAVKWLEFTLLNGLMRTPVPVVLFTFQIEPPAPGTYSAPFARAGWKTGSQKSLLPLPGAFQSDVYCHTTLRLLPLHAYFVSPQVCVA